MGCSTSGSWATGWVGCSSGGLSAARSVDLSAWAHVLAGLRSQLVVGKAR